MMFRINHITQSHIDDAKKKAAVWDEANRYHVEVPPTVVTKSTGDAPIKHVRAKETKPRPRKSPPMAVNDDRGNHFDTIELAVEFYGARNGFTATGVRQSVNNGFKHRGVMFERAESLVTAEEVSRADTLADEPSPPSSEP